MIGGVTKLTPLERAQRDALTRINNVHKYLTAQASVEREWYGDDRRKFHSLIRTIENREGQKQFLNRICTMGILMPTEFLLHIRGDFKAYGKQVEPKVYDFIREHAPRIEDCRDLYMKMYVVDKAIDMKTVKTRTTEKIIDIAYKYKEPRLEFPVFVRTVTPQIIRLPQVMSFSEMYDIYLRKIGHRVIRTDVAQNFVDYTEPEANKSRRDDKYAFDMRHLRQTYGNTSPWKTASKMEDYAKKYNWGASRLADFRERTTVDSFDMKKQRKLMKHYVSGRYGFVIDYMLSGVYRYLLAININTRKAFFAIPKEIYRVGHNWDCRKKGEWMPSGDSAIQSIRDLLERTPINSILMDNEGAFIDAKFKDFLTSNGIDYRYVRKYNVGKIMETQPSNRSRSTHSTSLIDRLIRTLRLMNHNLGNKQEIEPPVLNFLIDEYNNSVHGTLSKILGREVTPEMVDKDVALETTIVKHLRKQNFLMENNPDYAVTKTVHVYNDLPTRDFEKVKSKLIPGTWKYIGREDGLFKLQQNGTEIMVPRWMIKNNKF